MDLAFLQPDELRDVLEVLANAFVDRIMVEEKMTQTEAFIEVAAAVNVGRALSRERQHIRRIRQRRLEVVPVMSDHTTIEWTDATWNPITGCTLVSEGCRHCYAAQIAATRLSSHPSRAGLARLNAKGEAKFTGEVRFNEQWLDQPLRWKRGRRIFVCAHGDLFHENVQEQWITAVFRVMAQAQHHTFQVLTKRPERADHYLGDPNAAFAIGAAEWPLPNVWLGTSVEDQAAADERVDRILATPAAVRFVSYEPALGPVDFRPWLHDSDCHIRTEGVCICTEPREVHLDWIIAGGESGPHARPSHPDWYRKVRDDCAAAGVAFLFKQHGNWISTYDRDRDDPDWRRCDVVARGPGQWLNLAGGQGFHGDRLVRVENVGKKAAGRLLDGVEHNGFPA